MSAFPAVAAIATGMRLQLLQPSDEDSREQLSGRPSALDLDFIVPTVLRFPAVLNTEQLSGSLTL